jgi:hypothetical protein
MIEEILNPSSIERLAQYKEQFASNQPFKHLVIDDFLQPEFAQKMLDEFPKFNEKLALNENGEVGRKAVHEKVSGIGPTYKKLDQLAKSHSFLQWVQTVTGIDNLIYDPYYFGGGTHNNLSGQDLDPHVDFTHHPITGDHRRLNLIVYLNKEWHQAWGGNIEFHKNPRLQPEEDEIISVEPLFNRAVIFETNNISWHGFPRIDLPTDKQDLSRKSFALYYYTHHREQPVKPHSTIYVERHLPANYTAGMTLDEQGLQEVRTLLARRDQHLERLYNNITHLMTEVRDLKFSLGQAQEKNAQLEAGSKAAQTKSEPAPNNHDDSDRQALINRIHELENSSSWKITAPLRKFKRLFTKSN